MTKDLFYDDVNLVSNYFDGDTRSGLDTSVKLGKNKFKLPIVPANMVCSISFELSEKLSEEGYFYIMHRFCPRGVLKNWIRSHQHLKVISISLGVQKEDFEFISWLKESGLRVDYITIDIAHGHCKSMKLMLADINLTFHNDVAMKPYIIAGNVMTAKAVEDLEDWGANAVKVGIGPGSVCSTRLETGFCSPMFSTTSECSKNTPCPIIADGGVKHHGDIAKAMVAGATMVMAGNMFAACVDSPAEDVYSQVSQHSPEGYVYAVINKQLTHKRYFGSASAENKGHDKNVEGISTTIPCNGFTYLEKMDKIKQSLQSSMSYSGISDVSKFCTVEWTSR